MMVTAAYVGGNCFLIIQTHIGIMVVMFMNPLMYLHSLCVCLWAKSDYEKNLCFFIVCVKLLLVCLSQNMNFFFFFSRSGRRGQ